MVVIYSINLRTKKCCFATSDFIGLTLTEDEAEEIKHGETFMWPSLWQARDGEFLFLLIKAFSTFSF